MVRRIPRGFTLIELAVATVIIALLLGTILVPLHMQVEQRLVNDTIRTLENIKEALIGHAIAKGYLPCPDRTTPGGGGANDTANDGVEDFNAATGLCYSSTAAGNVPWVTLGVGAADPWGNRFRYRVDTDFANRPPAAGTPFTLTAGADLGVCTSAACTTRLTSTTVGDGAVAVILSHGKNGYGAMNSLTGTQRPLPASADEVFNLGGTTYASRPIFSSSVPATEFDDIVTWLGKYTLFNRMVAASKLP